MGFRKNKRRLEQKENRTPLDKKRGRREFLKGAARVAALGGVALTTGCGSDALGSSEEMSLRFKEYFKKNYRLMTREEKNETVRRLEKLAELRQGADVRISAREPVQGVLYGYAFNVTRCEGYMECVAACVKENNLDRTSDMQYIRIFEMEHGETTPDQGDGKFFKEVPVDGRYYMGAQCNHCENAPCIKACPTKATWQEPDGIVVVDYDWCIGCR
ncbi:MAG: 4Fe-4S dicluster domain-containing protein, partial [Desulfobacterales bacterium]|nr:4Fe-4S dicluster domain-containing protein [Desulfobacterales bacterium]